MVPFSAAGYLLYSQAHCNIDVMLCGRADLELLVPSVRKSGLPMTPQMGSTVSKSLTRVRWTGCIFHAAADMSDMMASDVS